MRFYNDSYSTTPETAEVAIQAFKVPKVLILGGSSKRSDFRSLGKTHFAIAEHPRDHRRRRRMAADQSAHSQSKNQDHRKVQTMAASCAKQKMWANGRRGASLPGCASFGMFRNYTERGKESSGK